MKIYSIFKTFVFESIVKSISVIYEKISLGRNLKES